MQAIELFVGAGGLALGVSRAGFSHSLVIDRDPAACNTVRENQRREVPHVADWPLIEDDIRRFDFKTLSGEIDFVVGGPPCQPFSLGGKHHGPGDDRNMFPDVVKVVRELRPRAFMFENVPGLLRPSLARYFEYIERQLAFPEITPRPFEDWSRQLQRLRRAKRGGGNGLEYVVEPGILNAANYGVPQRRKRVFIVGFRSDVALGWEFPAGTHSLDALLWSQYVTGEYWACHQGSVNAPLPVPDRFASLIERLKSRSLPPDGNPWRTVRDALVHLPDPESELATKLPNHEFRPGARQYPRHIGSPLDWPAKAIKAGIHGVPGGENMLLKPDGSVRYFTIREIARLQTFPDEFVFCGRWTQIVRQLGNAVPVDLAHVVASRIYQTLTKSG